MTINQIRVYMRTFLLFICVLFSVQSTWADNYLQNPSNFTAIPQGVDKIRFTLPSQYDGSQNEGIRKGYVKISVDGGAKQDLLYWGLGNNYNELTSDSESGKISIVSYYDGQWQLVGKVKGGPRYFNKNTGVSFTVGSNDDNSDHFRTEVEWTVPRHLRGMTLTFYLWCKSEDIGNSWYIPSGNSDMSSWYTMYEWDCPAAPVVNVSLNDPMLSYSTDHPGTIMIPYNFQAQSVREATIYYTDSLTGDSYSKKLSTKLVDLAYLPADRPWKNVYINARS